MQRRSVPAIGLGGIASPPRRSPCFGDEKAWRAPASACGYRITPRPIRHSLPEGATPLTPLDRAHKPRKRSWPSHDAPIMNIGSWRTHGGERIVVVPMAPSLRCRPCRPDRAHGYEPVACGGEPSVPAWLGPHVGEGEGQIAPVVLERARALYQRKRSEGAVRNPCYFAFDATRPHDLGGMGRRFYIVCEAEGSFRAISAGHGGGRDLDGVADFSNGRGCVKNFGNAMESDLTRAGPM